MIVYYVTKEGIKTEMLTASGTVGIDDAHLIYRIYSLDMKRFLRLEEVGEGLTEREKFIFCGETVDNSLWFLGMVGDFEPPMTRHFKDIQGTASSEPSEYYKNVKVYISNQMGIASITVKNFSSMPVPLIECAPTIGAIGDGGDFGEVSNVPDNKKILSSGDEYTSQFRINDLRAGEQIKGFRCIFGDLNGNVGEVGKFRVMVLHLNIWDRPFPEIPYMLFEDHPEVIKTISFYD